jgi:WD40 repeat protein
LARRNQIVAVLHFVIVVLANPAFAQTKAKEILWTTDWSPNGRFIALGGNVDSLKVYSGQNFRPYKSFPVKNTITRIKWHPTKNVMAVATQTSETRSFILSLDTDEKIELAGISRDGARGIDWHATGKYLVVADNDGQILIYTVKGELIQKFGTGNTKSITSVAWHPQKDILTTVSEVIRVFDIKGNQLKAIKHRPEEVLLLSVAWHKSGSFFVTGDYGNEKDKPLLQYWSEDGSLLKSIDISKGEYRNLSWNSKGTRLATASDALRIWDTKGNLLSAGSWEDYLWGVSWNKKGNRIVTSSIAQRIVLWNNKAERLLALE